MLLLGVVEGNSLEKKHLAGDQLHPLSCNTTSLLLVGGYFLFIFLILPGSLCNSDLDSP
jgi:hypothetical protein